MRTPVLAVDFGTSNSAAAILDGGTPRRLPIEAGADTLPTAVFFPANGSEMLIGTAANSALIDGDEGRYMRALKSILGAPLFHETRMIGGKRQTLSDVVTAFLLRHLSGDTSMDEKVTRAQVSTGTTSTSSVHRPSVSAQT